MDTLTGMRVFSAVVDAGSFAAAAERLDISRAMASKYVGQLEEHLGTRLLHRTTRKLGLTETGAAYHERCQHILGEIAEAEAQAAKLTLQPRGTLRLAMPISFSLRHIAPLLAGYLARYPEVGIDATLSDRYGDLIEEGFDLALRIGPPPEGNLIARQIASDRFAICAAPAYLEKHGVPATPEDLADHNCLLYSYSSAGNAWRLRGPDGAERTVKVAGGLRANNGDLLNQLGVDGVGILRQPCFLVGEQLREGKLIEVLKDYRSDPIGIYAVYPSRRHLSAKIRSFVDYLANHLKMTAD